VPLSKEVAAIAKGAADKTKAGDPRAERTIIGSGVVAHPVGQDPEVHRKGIEEGATLVAGGPGLSATTPPRSAIPPSRKFAPEY
jgi:aldehyde dehydrogenase (NAD+)